MKLVKEVLTNRVVMLTLLGCLLLVFGVHFWAEWQKKRFEESLPKLPATTQAVQADESTSSDARVPIVNTDVANTDTETGGAELVSIPEIPTAPKLFPEEQARRDKQWEQWAQAYREEWGDEPPWTSEYRHIRDCMGNARRLYRNRPVLVNYSLRIDFAPNPADLERYKALMDAYHRAEAAGNSFAMQNILVDMQELVDANQGELPARPYGFIGYGDEIPQEEARLRDEEATRELYELMGIGHLFEFYEERFYD